MTDKVLLTRPEADAQETAQTMKERGYEAVISPLLTMHFEENFSILPADGYIFTSSNAARAFSSDRKDVLAYAVGDKTAQILKEKGVKTIYKGEGEVASLLPLIQQTAPLHSRLVHVSGETLSVDITQELIKKGYKAERQIAYRTDYTEMLSPEAIRLLKNREIKAAFFYSPLSAGMFQKAILKAGGETSLSSVYAICLSQAITIPLQKFLWKGMLISLEKSTGSMIDALDKCFFKCDNNLKIRSGRVR